MFGFLKGDPQKKLEKEHAKILEKALHFQRNGDLRTYSELMAQAEDLIKKIDAIEEAKNKS